MIYRKTLIAGFIAAAAIATALQDAQPIQRTLVENTTDTYKSSAKVNQTLQSPLGDLPINISTATTYLLKTGKVDSTKGTADVELTTTIDSIDGGDSPLTAGLSKKKPGPIVQKGTIDKLGHLGLKTPETVDRTMTIFTGVTGGLQSSIFLELPDHPVKIGDTWDIVVPKGEFTGDSDQKLTAKLTGEKVVDGHADWTIELSGTVNISFDSSKFAPPSGEAATTLEKTHIVAKGVTVLKGNGLVDKLTGKTVSLDTTSDLKTSIELPDEGDMKAEGTGTLVTSLKIQN